MKHLIAVGRIIRGGAIQLVAPANPERLAMDADLDALLAGKPLAYRLTPEQLTEIEAEHIGQEIGQNPWRW